MFKKTQDPIIKPAVNEEVIITQGINPRNTMQRSMSSTSRLVHLFRPGNMALKTDQRDKLYYGNCSLENMGVNNEPPVPAQVDDHKIVFNTISPEEKLKELQMDDDGSNPCNESERSMQL